MALLQKEDILRGLSKIRSTKALADEIGLEDVGSALSLVETFYPASRIPAKVRFGVEEIMERIAARRSRVQPENGTSPSGDGRANRNPFSPTG